VVPTIKKRVYARGCQKARKTRRGAVVRREDERARFAGDEGGAHDAQPRGHIVSISARGGGG
jgi:hypothetical protein